MDTTLRSAGAATGGEDADGRGDAVRPNQPQQLLLTLLGDYWYGHREAIPSSTLVRLMGEFEVTPANSRAAISRLSRRRLLEGSKWGRRTFYALTDEAIALLDDGARRIAEFGATDVEWDGKWAVTVFSVPESERTLRHVLRERLRWLGFAPLYDGVWVSPRGTEDEAMAALRELGVSRATVFRGEYLDTSPADGDPLRAWDLDELADRYEEFTTVWSEIDRRVRQGRVDPAEALVARTRVMNGWRAFPRHDPELPHQLLPTHFPRRRARLVFRDLYNRLGPLAVRRVRELVAVDAPDLAELVSHHDVEFLDTGDI